MFPMQLVVDVNEKLLKEFRAFAAEKHGRLYNAPKPEVEKALRRHLDMEKGKIIFQRCQVAPEIASREFG